MSQYLFFDCSWTPIHHCTEKKTRMQIITRELAKTASHNVTIHITIGKVRTSSNSHILSLPNLPLCWALNINNNKALTLGVSLLSCCEVPF